MEDSKAEESSAIDAGQAAISTSSDVDGTHVHIFESSQPEDLDVGDLQWLQIDWALQLKGIYYQTSK